MDTRGLVPLFLMILVQLVYAGMNITSKLAMQSGMNPLILVAYRQIFATVSIFPFAYWLEWNTVPRMTKRIMFQLLVSSLTGATGNQVLYFWGLKYSTATIACALSNLLPAFTFILAVIFRQENVKITKKASVAKVLGTVLCVGGALLLSFYHGKVIGLGESSIHWGYADKIEGTSTSGKSNSLLGPFVLIASSLVWALWFIIQADISKKFPAPYTSTFYMCFLASFQCVVIALCFEHRASEWSLYNAMRLTSSLYAGIVCTGLAYCLISWTIERRGPLYVSVFTPLQLVITAIVSWALLREKLYVGTAMGSLVIVFGLYSVLWGKNKEVNNKDAAIEVKVMEAIKDEEKDAKNDMELKSYMPSNGNHHVVT
ncbi:WAT1-related protein At1g09380-like [Gastrolobium bilobum]|uniref:WAT1-related protein At1g09380-like n=1 Tax=Gastrolobium bilobum TaxID=150636 RepID=UPI002AB0B1FA|nr:WAT1-related protein At1g09380-like [Gastrolobium bilobum]